MPTVTVALPTLRDAALVADALDGAVRRAAFGRLVGTPGYAVAYAALVLLSDRARRGATSTRFDANASEAYVIAKVCRSEAHALEIGRRVVADISPDRGPSEGELALLTIALGCEAALEAKAA